ncbi:MAG: GNAT family N-acetyltransferase [Sphingorhabdus sp.]
MALSSVADSVLGTLLDDAFGADRHQRTAYLLRKGMNAIDHLSFGILDGDELVGSIQCWPICVADAPLTLVGPVAVASYRQNAGLGTRLMQLMLDATRANDAPMMMIGDPEYYGRFGFTAERTSGWTLPGPWEPRRLLLRNPAMLELPEHGMLGPAD